MELHSLYEKRSMIDDLYARFSTTKTELVFKAAFQRCRRESPTLRVYIKELAQSLPDNHQQLRFELNAARLQA